MTGLALKLLSKGRHMARTRYQRPTVKRRGRSWWAEWHVYVTEDGRERRKHREGTFGLVKIISRAEAQATCDARVAEETGQAVKADGGMTVERFWDSVYLPIRSRRWSYNTRINLESTWKLHIKPAFGSLRLDVVNKASIERHLIRLADAGLGVQLLGRVRTMVRSIFEEALENDFIGKNPARRIELPACKPTEETRSLSEQEVARLFSVLSVRDRLLFRVLILCGPRLGEALALRWSDVRDGWLVLDESALRGAPAPTKNRKVRRAPIPGALRQELEAWRGMATDGSLAGLVFPTDRGRMMWQAAAQQSILPRARKLSGIADLDFRMCRRTFATLYRGDVKDVQEILGHHSADLTMEWYKQAIPERQMRAVEELEQRLNSPQSSADVVRKVLIN